MGRLTDKQKKRIIADRTEGLSIRQLAQKYHVSTTTIQRTLRGDPELTRKVTEKKEQNTTDILEHMEGKRDKVCAVIDRYLDALLDEERIGKATPAQLTTAMGTLIDKFTATKGSGADAEADDPITKSLKEAADAIGKAD